MRRMIPLHSFPILLLICLLCSASAAGNNVTACSFDSTSRHYIAPVSCPSALRVQSCNSSFTSCLVESAGNCTEQYVQCTQNFVLCINRAVMHPSETAECPWALDVRAAIISALAGSAADYNQTYLYLSCAAITCNVSAASNCAMPTDLEQVCGSAQSLAESVLFTKTEDMPNPKAVSRSLSPTKSRSVTLVGPPETTSESTVNYTQYISQMNDLRAQIAAKYDTLALDKIVISPLPAGCPSWISQLADPTTPEAREMMRNMTIGTPRDLILTRGEKALSLNFYVLVMVEKVTAFEPNASATAVMDATYDDIREYLGLGEARDVFSHCFMNPTTTTTMTMTTQTTTVMTTGTEPTTTSDDWNTTIAPTTEPESTMTAATPEPPTNFTPAPTALVPLIFTATVENNPAKPFNLASLVQRLADLVHCDPGEINVNVTASNATIYSPVTVEFRFVGESKGLLQAEAQNLTSGELRNIGIVSMAARDENAKPELPFFEKHKDMFYVAGGGILLFILGIVVARKSRRFNRRTYDDYVKEQGNPFEVEMPLLPTELPMQDTMSKPKRRLSMVKGRSQLDF